MTVRDDGGVAFPLPSSVGRSPDRGMSLRDWFAGQALAGYLATHGDCRVKGSHAADVAYAVADAMLAERSKP